MWGPRTLAENHHLLLFIRVTNSSTQHYARSLLWLILLDELAFLLPHRCPSDTLLPTPLWASDETTQTIPVLTLRKFRKYMTKSQVDFTTDHNTVVQASALTIIKKAPIVNTRTTRLSRELITATSVCVAHAGWLCCI